MRQGQQSADKGQMLEDRVFLHLAERGWAGKDFKITAQGNTVTLSGTVPNEAARARIMRIVRMTPGVVDATDRLQVSASAAASRTGTAIPDRELAQRVARQIAGKIPGAKAGEDWWFTGWRVEGDAGLWNLTVEADDGQIFLNGDVPRPAIARQAVQAALEVPGVQSVRSDFDLDRYYVDYPYYGHPYRAWGYPYYGPYWGHPYAYGLGLPPGQRGVTGAHSVTGEVVQVDPQQGTLALKTDQGTLDLHFPSSALQGLKKGDRVSVQFSLREAGARAGQ
jgi:hypothetical protein